MAAVGRAFAQVLVGVRNSRPGPSPLYPTHHPAPGSRYGTHPQGFRLLPDTSLGRQLLHQGRYAALAPNLLLGAFHAPAGRAEVLNQQNHSRLEFVCGPPAPGAHLRHKSRDAPPLLLPAALSPVGADTSWVS